MINAHQDPNVLVELFTDKAAVDERLSQRRPGHTSYTKFRTDPR